MVKVIQPSGNVARVKLRQELTGVVDDIPIYTALKASEVKGLPDPVEGTIYITSSAVAMFVKRPDVVCTNHAPDECNRNYRGEVISVRSLLTYNDIE